MTHMLRPVLETIKKLVACEYVISDKILNVLGVGGWYFSCRFDARGLFAYPVDPNEVADYLDVIKTPMDFETMTKKLENDEYLTIDQIQVMSKE